MSNSSLHGFNDNDAASDLTSIKSEESTDSENFVIVGQAEDPEAAETALFNIHSKRASPVVEVAAEVIIAQYSAVQKCEIKGCGSAVLCNKTFDNIQEN